MPLVVLDDIQQAVEDRVRAQTHLLPVKYHDKKFDDNRKSYAHLMIIPNDTESETIDGGDVLSGFILVNIYVVKDYGTKFPTVEGQKFIDLFPRDFTMGEIRIVKTGTIRSPVKDEKWNYTPVLIEYEASSCPK